MEMQDRTDFEREWKSAFAEAEADVSPAVWNNIEQAVGATSGSKYKKRLLVLTLLAAASVAFALSVAGVGVYRMYLNDDPSNVEQIAGTDTGKADVGEGSGRNAIDLAKESNDQQNVVDANDPLITLEREHLSENTEEKRIPGASDTPASDLLTADTKTGTDAEGKVKLSGESQGENVAIVSYADTRKLELEPQLVDRRFAFLQTSPIAYTELRMVPWYSYIPTKKNSSARNVWAGVGFSAGSLDPNTSSSDGGNQEFMQTFDGVTAERSPSFLNERDGQAINMGVNVGIQVFDKWVLQSGITYTQQQTTSTSNVVLSNVGSTAKTLSNHLEIKEEDKLVFTAPYDVNNTYELISVPLQAGYIVLDHDIQVIILGGVANSILLKSEVSDESGNFDDVTIPAGDRSRYKTYQLSAIVGSEISYLISTHYQLSLIPQIRQSVNSVTKSEAGYLSRPTILEIGFRFKYVF